MVAPIASEWCLVANVKPAAYGRATATGTRHFSAGAKVWCLPMRADYDRCRVIGRHRGSHRHILIMMPSERLTNWRAKLAFHPEVVRLIVDNGRWPSQEACETTARQLMASATPIDDIPAAAAVLGHALHLLATDPRGQELEALASVALAAHTPQQRKLDPQPPPEVLVLADWLEDHGVGLPLDELVTTLDRRRNNR